MEFERRLDECERLRAQYDQKLITMKDMAPDRCLSHDTGVEHSFSKTVSSSLAEYTIMIRLNDLIAFHITLRHDNYITYLTAPHLY